MMPMRSCHQYRQRLHTLFIQSDIFPDKILIMVPEGKAHAIVPGLINAGGTSGPELLKDIRPLALKITGKLAQVMHCCNKGDYPAGLICGQLQQLGKLLQQGRMLLQIGFSTGSNIQAMPDQQVIMQRLVRLGLSGLAPVICPVHVCCLTAFFAL